MGHCDRRWWRRWRWWWQRRRQRWRQRLFTLVIRRSAHKAHEHKCTVCALVESVRDFVSTISALHVYTPPLGVGVHETLETVRLSYLCLSCALLRLGRASTYKIQRYCYRSVKQK